MLRRSTLLSALAACVLSAAPSAHAAAPKVGNPPPAEMPRANCSHRLIDQEGDAKYPVALGQNAQNVDGLDLNGVLLRMTPDLFEVFISAKAMSQPGSMPPYAGAFVYNATLKYGNVGFTFKWMENSTAAPWTLDPTPTVGTPAAGTGSGGATTLPGATADQYIDKNYVVFTVPRASMESAVGGPISDGDQFTSIVVQGILYYDNFPTTVDSLDVPAATAAFTVGDDYCFGPPPGSLSDLVTPAAVFTDGVKLNAKLVSEAGSPLAGKPVQFTVTGEDPLVGTTGADGVATVTYVPTKVGAGTYPVDVRFLGDTEAGKAKLAGTIVVTAETSAFNPLVVTKPSATTRTVTATLLDNDKHAIAGQKVDWYVNGKKVATLVTDSKGKSIFKTAKPTQTVQAKFAGVAGKYSAATAKAVKV